MSPDDRLTQARYDTARAIADEIDRLRGGLISLGGREFDGEISGLLRAYAIADQHATQHKRARVRRTA